MAPSLISKAIKEGKLRACVLSPQTVRVLPEDASEWLHAHRAIQDEKAPAKEAKVFKAKKKAASSQREQAASEGLRGLEDLDWVLET